MHAYRPGTGQQITRRRTGRVPSLAQARQ